jgi:hypothetical protein
MKGAQIQKDKASFKEITILSPPNIIVQEQS